MTLLEAIDIRRSRRKYLPNQIEAQAKQVLLALANEYSELAGDGLRAGTRIELVFDNPGAFDSLRKTYGMLTGVRNYAGLIARKDDKQAVERLHATALGLGTCWVGGTFDRALCPVELEEGEEVVCAITVGEVKPGLSVKEKLIHSMTHRKTKTAEAMYTCDGPVPEWFPAGMRAVEKAPSAVNRRPVTFACRNGTVSAAVEDMSLPGMAFDLGIAKLHFELGAGGGSWEFGNGAAYTRCKES
jgi:hypothetical protein